LTKFISSVLTIESTIDS